jgi:hypothetical protein
MTKQATSEQILHALRRVLDGGIYVSDAVATHMIRGAFGGMLGIARQCRSIGLGSFRFRFHCVQVGICSVFARFLRIAFQRLALRNSDFCFALSLSNR